VWVNGEVAIGTTPADPVRSQHTEFAMGSPRCMSAASTATLVTAMPKMSGGTPSGCLAPGTSHQRRGRRVWHAQVASQ
jgi:hypothetical protein